MDLLKSSTSNKTITNLPHESVSDTTGDHTIPSLKVKLNVLTKTFLRKQPPYMGGEQLQILKGVICNTHTHKLETIRRNKLCKPVTGILYSYFQQQKKLIIQRLGI